MQVTLFAGDPEQSLEAHNVNVLFQYFLDWEGSGRCIAEALSQYSRGSNREDRFLNQDNWSPSKGLHLPATR